jgi:CubicO group peptidase (beta-lactamase class C family)
MASPRKLSLRAANDLRDLINSAVASPLHPIPVANVVVVSRTGETLFSHAAGEARPVNGSMRPVGMHDMFALASSTKLIVAVAIMQLVERGKVGLDDPEIIEHLLSDLMSKPLLTGFEAEDDGSLKPLLQPRNSPITLRMLLNHTAGLGYTFFNKLLWQFIRRDLNMTEGINGWNTVSCSPLVLEPGTKFEYGAGFDWASVLLERLTKQTLYEYLNNEIFTPLGMENTTFPKHMTPEQISSFTPPHMRLSNGTVVAWPAPPPQRSTTDIPNCIHGAYSGSGNIVSSAPDYSKLISTLLNKGTCPTTNAKILNPESVETLLSPCLPAHLTPLSGQISPAGPDMSFAVSGDFSEGDANLGWSFAGALRGSDKPGGRRKGTVYWMGLTGTDWWVDSESGIGVVVWGALFPFMDPAWKNLISQIERVVYAGLQ